MQIPAKSIGEAVPRLRFEALVHSVFDTAANLQLQHEDRMITIVSSDHYDLPQGIRLSPGSVPLRDLAVGSRANAQQGVLSFASSIVQIDLREARLWHCPVRDLGTDLEAPGPASAWSQAWQLLNAWQTRLGAELVADDLLAAEGGSALTRRLRAPVTVLEAAAARLDIDASKLAADSIIGLGGGVTPSGDDVLVGFMAGLWSMAADNEQRVNYVSTFGNSLIQRARGTTAISRTFVWHAALAQFSSSLSGLAQALASGTDVAAAAEEAFRVGHTSGMDAATGLLLGLAAWSPGIRSRLRVIS